jgi:hypothetical protein
MDASAGEPGQGEILKANVVGPDLLQVGMQVMSMNGQVVGRVKEVRENDFLIDRPMARDVYMPYRFVLGEGVEAERFRGGPSEAVQVVLTVTEGQLDSEDWPHP